MYPHLGANFDVYLISSDFPVPGSPTNKMWGSPLSLVPFSSTRSMPPQSNSSKAVFTLFIPCTWKERKIKLALQIVRLLTFGQKEFNIIRFPSFSSVSSQKCSNSPRNSSVKTALVLLKFSMITLWVLIARSISVLPSCALKKVLVKLWS